MTEDSDATTESRGAKDREFTMTEDECGACAEVATPQRVREGQAKQKQELCRCRVDMERLRVEY